MGDFVRDKNAIKNGMSTEQVFKFLSDMGIAGKWLEEDTLLFETCCHNHIGEGSHKLYYYGNTKLFFCYTHCGRFDIFELLNKMNVIKNNEELSLEEAIDSYISSQSFVVVSRRDDSDMGVSTNINLFDKEYEKPQLNKFDKREYLKYPRYIIKNWEEEGISAETQHKYNIRVNFSQGSIMFPHLDQDLNLVAIRQRIVDPEKIIRLGGKYRPLQREGVLYSSPSSFYLFGLAENQRNIRIHKKAIVYEGEKSCMKMDDILSPRDNISTATFGMKFSIHQFKLLESLGVDEIVLGYDKQFKEASRLDSEFIELMGFFERIDRTYSDNPKKINITFMIDDKNLLEYKDAPVDRGFEVFESLYRNRKTFTEWKNILLPPTEWDEIGMEDEEDIF